MRFRQPSLGSDTLLYSEQLGAAVCFQATHQQRMKALKRGESRLYLRQVLQSVRLSLFRGFCRFYMGFSPLPLARLRVRSQRRLAKLVLSGGRRAGSIWPGDVRDAPPPPLPLCDLQRSFRPNFSGLCALFSPQAKKNQNVLSNATAQDGD